MAATRPTAFGDLLKRYRLAAGLTHEQLAERSGLSARGISDLERGQRQRPHKDTLLLLAEALQLAQPQRAALFAATGRWTESASSEPFSLKDPSMESASDLAEGLTTRGTTVKPRSGPRRRKRIDVSSLEVLATRRDRASPSPTRDRPEWVADEQLRQHNREDHLGGVFRGWDRDCQRT